MARPDWPEVRFPGALNLPDNRRGQLHQLSAEVGQDHQPGTAVRRVGDAVDVPGAFQLVHDRPEGLLADLCGLSQLGEPRPGRSDPLENARLAQGKVMPVLLERSEHGRLHEPVRDEQQQSEVQRLRLVVHDSIVAEVRSPD